MIDYLGENIPYDKREYNKLYRAMNRERLRNYENEREKKTDRIIQRSLYSKEYYKTNKEKIRIRNKKYNEINKHKRQEYSTAWRQELIELWGNSHSCTKRVQEMGFRAERIMTKVIASLGYDDVIHVAGIYPNFPVDILARKFNAVHSFQVTIYPRRKIEKRAMELTQWMQWIPHIIFVRPTYTDYWDVVLNYSRKAASVPVSIVTSQGEIIPNELRSTL